MQDFEETKSDSSAVDCKSDKDETIFSDSKLSVSDRNGFGNWEFRGAELDDITRENYFAKKTDVYAIGVILEKLIGKLEVSHELKEATKLATDENIEGRANLQQLYKILRSCLDASIKA